MSTEHKNDLETNALGDRLGRGWEQFKQGKLVSYRVMAIVLLVVTAVGLFFYIRAEQVSATSKAWLELENANSVASLEEFAKSNTTTTGKVAQLQLARYLLGPDGIDKLTSREEAERKKAVENVEKARDLLARLADEFKDDIAFKAECYRGLSKAETALVGVPKEGSATDFRGSVEKVTEWLDKLADVGAGTKWGDEAKKLSDSLKTDPKVKEELVAVQRTMYKQSQEPQLPAGGAFPPLGSGAFPGGTSLPGLPGGPIRPIGSGTAPPTSPLAPPAAPPKTPPTPSAPAPATPAAPPTPPMTPPAPGTTPPAPTGVPPAAPPAPIAPPPTPPAPGTTPPAPSGVPPTAPPAPPKK